VKEEEEEEEECHDEKRMDVRIGVEDGW